MRMIRDVRTDVEAAREVARLVLADLPGRWRHTAGVAGRAVQLRPAVAPHDADVLVAAAWLHDIGYARALHDTGFHPLDGARFLDRAGWPGRISALVAHHSGAVHVARVRGLARELAAYPREISPVADALTVADQTTDPDGGRTDVRSRMAEMLRRQGPGSDNALAHERRGPDLLAAHGRVEQRLRRAAEHSLV
jgi:hypothetical protein